MLNNQKQCTKCKITKDIAGFSKLYITKDGLRSRCKKCLNIIKKEYGKTKEGLISKIYSNQKSHSKTRGHIPPLYTKQQFSEWLLNQKLFHILYTEWVESGYKKELVPSCDRRDDNLGYSFNNIKLTIWIKNKTKGHADHKSGKLDYDLRPVYQFTKDEVLIAEFVSTIEASRQTNVNQSNISQCCIGNKKYSHAGGFIWRHKT